MLKLSCVILLLLSYQVSAQIQVVSSDFPGKADTVRYTNTNDFSIDYQTTGVDFNWDFSYLIGNSQTLLKHNSVDDADMLTQNLFGQYVLPTYRASYYLPATAIPFGLLSDFLDIPIEDFYRFFRKTSSAVNCVGLSLSAGGFGLGSRSDTIEVAYQFPMEYGQSYNSRGYTFIDLSFVLPAQFKQYRQRFSEVDGYGEIETPYGTFDVLRIHHIIDELDSVYFEFNGGGQWIELPIPTSHEYEWWTNEKKGPVLKIVTNEIGGNEQVTSVQYRDIYRADLVASIVENQTEQFVIFPNPTSHDLNISTKDVFDTVFILSSNGELVLQSHFKSSIDVSGLANGSYTILLRSNSGQFVWNKFIKQ